MSRTLPRWHILHNVLSASKRPLVSTLKFRRTAIWHGPPPSGHRPYSTHDQSLEPSDTRASSIPAPPESTELAAHLNSVFSPLQFSPELAARILTHSSHRHAIFTHNARLSFIGRRVLQSYLMLFLQSTPAVQSTYDFNYIADNALNTYVLGEFVGPRWGLPKAMKWRPASISLDQSSDAEILTPDLSRSVGLYKVTGIAVEAVMGGVFHQFGGNIAHRLFHTRLLPHILLPGRKEGLPEAFHRHATRICGQMGGQHGSLTGPIHSKATR